MPSQSDPSNRAKYALLAAATVVAIQAIPTTAGAQVVSQPPRQNLPSDTRMPRAIKPFSGTGGATRMIGMMAGAPVYADSAGTYFTVDAATGQPVQVPAEQVARSTCCYTFIKIRDERKSKASAAASRAKTDARRFIKFGYDDIRNVEIVGVDADGRVLHRNNRGEIFHVDPATGDFIFVKP
ncbi:MAG: hypothetical protein SFU57_13475 [Gemmatimonadales bacterium]|nr:hypothetical protein [Gemmatimonadales bacterium]